MKAKTNISSPGGTGVLLLEGRALPVSSIHEFATVALEVTSDTNEEQKDEPEYINVTRILLNDQASGASQYGTVVSRREYRDVEQPLQDVVMAYNLASRGYVIDVNEFCQRRATRKKGVTRLDTSPLL